MPQAGGTENGPSEGSTYVGIDTLQEQTRVKALRKGYTFNLMVVGRSGLGKSTLVNTLFKTQVARRKPGISEPLPSTTHVKSTSATLTEGGVRLNLTITDTPGFGDHVNNENCWDPILSYIRAQYERFLTEETKVDRPLHIQDTRVHCCIYFIPPTGHYLSSLDVEVLKHLHQIVSIVPVVAKSDTLTLEERISFKERIRSDLLHHGIKIYPTMDYEDKEDETENNKIRERLPFAIVGSTAIHENGLGRKVLGRKSNWGLVEVENKSHNDFSFLRDLLIRTHMQDLMMVTSQHHYENYRRAKLTSAFPKMNGQTHMDQMGESKI